MELISREELKYVISSIIEGVEEEVSSWDENESREMAVHKAVMSKCVEAMSILAGVVDQMPTIESRPKIEPLPKGTDLNDLPGGVYKPRPIGKWIDHSEDGYAECPFCNEATNCDGNIEELHYCWNCGAKLGTNMRGE